MQANEAQVTPINDPEALDTFKQWITTMGNKGVLPIAMVKNWSTAVQRLSDNLGDDEPKTVTFFRDHIDDIGRRWINAERANPETGQTYVQRARAALDDYKSFCEDPLKYKPKASRSAGAAKPEEKKPKTAPPPAGQSTPEAPRPEAGDLRTFPMGQAGVFKYALPAKGLTMKEAFKIYCHLVTYADDFDPIKAQAQIVGLAKVDD